MKWIKLAYAQHYKRRYSHIGHFGQDRFKSIIIPKDEYLFACGSYVELNPVRANMVDGPIYMGEVLIIFFISLCT